MFSLACLWKLRKTCPQQQKNKLIQRQNQNAISRSYAKVNIDLFSLMRVDVWTNLREQLTTHSDRNWQKVKKTMFSSSVRQCLASAILVYFWFSLNVHMFSFLYPCDLRLAGISDSLLLSLELSIFKLSDGRARDGMDGGKKTKTGKDQTKAATQVPECIFTKAGRTLPIHGHPTGIPIR